MQYLQFSTAAMGMAKSFVQMWVALQAKPGLKGKSTVILKYVSIL